VSDPVGVDQVEAVDRMLIECSFRLGRVVTDALGPQAMSIEAQLRWEDHLADMPTAELDEIALRRSRASGGPPVPQDIESSES